MPEYTPKLNLYKNNLEDDGKKPFSIKTSLNDNWDKIDTAFANIPTDSVTRTELNNTLNSRLETLMSDLYPVGSIYMGVSSYNGTCPITKLLPRSTWRIVASDRCLQGSSSSKAPGQELSAGLPDITASWVIDNKSWLDGTVCTSPTSNKKGADGSGGVQRQCLFKASGGSSVYGRSTTVQPPAYVVNIWQRVS